MKKLNALIITIFIVFNFFSPLYAHAAQTNILVIHSYHAEHPWTSFQKQGYDEAFNAIPNIEVFHEYMDGKRNPTNVYESFFYQYLKQKYASYHLSAIVITDDPAMDFIRKYKSELFASLPIVFSGLNRITPDLLTLKGVTGVFEDRDMQAALIDIKKFTQSDKLIVISDSTSTGVANIQKVLDAQSSPGVPTQIFVINSLRDVDTQKVLSIYPNNTPIFLVGQIVDTHNNNGLMNWNMSTTAVTEVTDTPVFSIGAINYENNSVATYETDGVQHAKTAASLVLKILDGTNVDDIAPITKIESTWFFNWINVKKHHLEDNEFPKNSVFTRKEKTFYEENKNLVHIVIGVFIFALLLIVLLIEILRRSYQSRKLLSENQERYRDLAHAGANVFWETDAQHHFSYVSGNTLEVFEFAPQELLGVHFENVFRSSPNLLFPWHIYDEAVKNKTPLTNVTFKINTKNRTQKIILLNGKPIFDNKGNFMGYRGITREITEEHMLSEQVAYQASHDGLTGLINRNTFNQKLAELETNNRYANDTYIAFLDLDNFKVVNDTVGHLSGDMMLREIADSIAICISDKDVIGRLGGDEFGIIFYHHHQSEVQKICDEIIEQVQNYKLHWHNKYFSVGISIGVVPYTHNENSVELLSKADLACYRAKELGRSRVYLAGKNDEQLYQEELQLGYISSVAQAIEQDRFFLVKQMIAPVDDIKNTSKHYEILIRYRDEKGDLISPALFIPAAEKRGLIILIDKWVVKTVFEQYKNCFPQMDTVLSINLSGISFCNPEFVEYLEREVKQSDINPNNICFEITETAVISQINKAQSFIDRMKALGYKFALDDFGSGASSFGYLKQLPVDYLKIDGSLVKNIVNEPTDRAIVESINSIAHMMGMETIAEFVEDDNIRNVLKGIGVDYIQGFGIHKPEVLIAPSPQP